RWWKEAARGWIAVPRCRSTSKCGTPCEASRAEAVRPTRLPPVIRTGTSGSAIFLLFRCVAILLANSISGGDHRALHYLWHQELRHCQEGAGVARCERHRL